MTKLLRLRKLNLAVLRKQLAGTEKDRAAEMEDEHTLGEESPTESFLRRSLYSAMRKLIKIPEGRLIVRSAPDKNPV